MFLRSNRTEAAKTKSPVEEILRAFTEGSREMHSFLGFPGVLLIVTVISIALPAVPGYNLAPDLAIILASVALAGSVVTYSAQRYQETKRAEAQTEILRQYTQSFLEKYLAGKDKVGPGEVQWSINNILKPLIGEPPQRE